MIKLINLSHQGFDVFLTTPEGPKSLWVHAKEAILIPAECVSEQIRRLVQKKVFRLEKGI